MTYPAATLFVRNNNYYVSVTIPIELRPAFGNGNSTNKRLSTGTSDKDLAQLKLNELAAEIYKLFDQKKFELADKEADVQRKLVTQFAKNMKVKLKSDYQLYSTTPVIGLYKLQSILDRKAEQIVQEETGSLNYELAKRYLEDDITDFFEVIIRQSSERSGVPIPTPDRKTRNLLPISKRDGTWWIDPKPEYEITKPVQFKPQSVLVSARGHPRVLDLLEPYMKDANYAASNTLSKVRRGVNLFAKVMGNPIVAEIKPRDLFKYIQAYVDSRPTQPAENTIRDYRWYMQRFLDWCVRNEHLERNPFDIVKFQAKEFGRSGESRLPFSNNQLTQIFAQKMEPQDRLLLSLLITTGMRIDEAALLKWEQYQEIESIRCFSLIGARVKNRGSQRIVPVPDCVTLPTVGSGRLFSYRTDTDGKATTAAGQAVNPIIQKVCNERLRNSAHSMRHTFKDLMRNAGVSKEMNDFITGHGIGDAGGGYGEGHSVTNRYQAMMKIKHRWLEAE
jgi:integrase